MKKTTIKSNGYTINFYRKERTLEESIQAFTTELSNERFMRGLVIKLKSI